VINLPLTDEEIEAKVAELVDREFGELIEASGIETNLRLRERASPTSRRTWCPAGTISKMQVMENCITR
jgi:hypothetical protein